MSDVPGEILWDMLSRLLVLDLLRFRCVSKLWKSLIDSNEFITHHLNRSLKDTNSNQNLILYNVIAGCNLYSTDFSLLNETNRAHFQQLAHPLKTKLGASPQVLGSCHGLLVLSAYLFRKTTILWNPSIKRFHEVPYDSFECSLVKRISHGFGYDVMGDDYKLVRMVESFENADIEVKVYSLKFNSWRRIPDIPYYLRYGSFPGELANGALHWNVRSKVNSDPACLVIAFDLGTEEFNLVPLPEFAANDHFLYVFVLGGCLSLMLYVDDNVNIWVMKEYGVQESWSFLFRFESSHDFNIVRPIAYSKCNRKVLLGFNGGALMWYDLVKKSTDLPMVQMHVDMSQGMYTCLQSLVLLNNGTCDFDH